MPGFSHTILVVTATRMHTVCSSHSKLVELQYGKA